MQLKKYRDRSNLILWLSEFYDQMRAAQPVSGFVPVIDSATEMTFGTGTVLASDGSYRMEEGIQKVFGTAWAEGDAAGGDFTSIGSTSPYYVFTIAKDIDPQVVDIGFDDNEDGANAPSGWTVLREVFRGMTNSSGNIDDFTVTETAGGGLYVEYDVHTREFSDNSTGTNRVDKTLSMVPPDTLADMVWTYLEGTGSASSDAELLITRKGQTDTAPNPSNYSLRIRLTSASSDEAESVSRWSVKTNTDRIVCYRCSVSASVLFVQGQVIGYWLERR